MATIDERQITMGEHNSNPMLPEMYTLQRVRKETYDTFTLELEPTSGSRGISYKPGQFNMLYVFGTGEIPISISGDPAVHKLLVHTVRSVGIVTKALWQLKRGDLLGVRGPFGNAWPIEESSGQDVVIVAGGIGLAPLRPMIYQLLSERSKYGKIVLLYGARTPDDLLYRLELEQWRSRFDLDVSVSVDRASGNWQGNVGVVTTLIPHSQFDPMHTLAVVCGPEIMMRFTVLELQKRGISKDRIYISAERNMRCGIGHCGHCQYGQAFVCKDGPVFRFDKIADLFTKREI
jgi:NAD(P)H-flavin reductase